MMMAISAATLRLLMPTMTSHLRDVSAVTFPIVENTRLWKVFAKLLNDIPHFRHITFTTNRLIMIRVRHRDHYIWEIALQTTPNISGGTPSLAELLVHSAPPLRYTRPPPETSTYPPSRRR